MCNVTMDRRPLADVPLEIGPGEWTGCRPGRCKSVPFREHTAPSKGGILLPAVRGLGAAPVGNATEEEKGTLAASATHIARGVKALEREGVAEFKAGAAADMRECQTETETALLTTSPEIPMQGSQTVEVVVAGPTERARTAALASGIGAIKTVDEAMASQWWPIFKARMEEEILGKIGNQAWTPVPRPDDVPVMGYIIDNETSNPLVCGGSLKTPTGLCSPPDYFEESDGLYAVHDSSWGKRPRPQAGHAVMRNNAALRYTGRPAR